MFLGVPCRICIKEVDVDHKGSETDVAGIRDVVKRSESRRCNVIQKTHSSLDVGEESVLK